MVSLPMTLSDLVTLNICQCHSKVKRDKMRKFYRKSIKASCIIMCNVTDKQHIVAFLCNNIS